MDFLELTKKRYSVRNYSTKGVEKEKLDKILEAACNAPTAKNCQPLKIFVLTSEESREKLKKITNSHYNAPCVFMICYNTEESWFKPENPLISLDAAIVGTHMMMEATELGLGTVWVAAFNQELAGSEFALPPDLIPAILMPVGYASDDSAPAPRHSIRKSLKEMVDYL